MIQFKSFYLLVHIGMDLQSFTCTLTIHCRSLKKLQQNWEINFDSLLMKLAWLIALLNFLVRQQLDNGTKPRKHRPPIQIQRRPVVALVRKRPSIWIHTSIMPLEIMWKQSEPMAPVIHTARRLYVSHHIHFQPNLFSRVSLSIVPLKASTLVPTGGSSLSR